MTNIVYQITMGSGYALGIDSNHPEAGNQLILKGATTNDQDQLWSLVVYPPTNGFVLFNPFRGRFAAPASDDNGASVILFDLPDSLTFSALQTWEAASTAPYPIRTMANDDLNLNAEGNDWQPGTPIIVWKWDSGLNSTWTFKPVRSG